MLHDLDEFPHPFIEDRGVGADEPRKIAGEPEDVPGIDQGPAFDAALDQVKDLLGDLGCLGQFPAS